MPQGCDECMRPRHNDALPLLILGNYGGGVVGSFKKLTCREGEDRSGAGWVWGGTAFGFD